MKIELDLAGAEQVMSAASDEDKRRAQLAVRTDLKTKSWKEVMSERGVRGIQELDALLNEKVIDKNGNEVSVLEPKDRIRIAKFFVERAPQNNEYTLPEVKIHVDMSAAALAGGEVQKRIAAATKTVDVAPNA